jgi:hypothetical protein
MLENAKICKKMQGNVRKCKEMLENAKIKTSALTKLCGLRYCAYTHSFRLNLLIYLGPEKNEKFQKLSKL